MTETLKTLLGNQYEASLCTLNYCIERCPDENWNARVANLKFCQAAFHALFYADFYLGQSPDDFKKQPFHRENASFFADYEEFEDRAPVKMYERPAIEKYMQHCRTRANQIIVSESADSLAAPCGFRHKTFSRAELHVYNIRHIQHHAAQLSLRLRLDANVDIPWVGSGWRAQA